MSRSGGAGRPGAALTGPGRFRMAREEPAPAAVAAAGRPRGGERERERALQGPGVARRGRPSLSRAKLHGLRHMCAGRAAAGGSFQRRALWVLAFCTSLGLLLSWSSNRLLYWLSFPSHTRVHREWSRQLPFPAVTVCNNNPLRFPRLSKGDLYYAGHWLGLLLPNRTARPLVSELLRGDEPRRQWFRKLADFRLFLPPRHFEGISAAFMDRLGHQLEDMLLSCKYRGELCGPHNFSSVSCPPRGPAPPISRVRRPPAGTPRPPGLDPRPLAVTPAHEAEAEPTLRYPESSPGCGDLDTTAGGVAGLACPGLSPCTVGSRAPPLCLLWSPPGIPGPLPPHLTPPGPQGSR